MLVLRLVIVSLEHMTGQAPTVGEPSLCLPVVARWNSCGPAAKPSSPGFMRDSILMCWLRVSTCRQSNVVSCQFESGLLHQFSACACTCMCGRFHCGWTTKRRNDGVGRVPVLSGQRCTLCRWGM